MCELGSEDVRHRVDRAGFTRVAWPVEEQIVELLGADLQRPSYRRYQPGLLRLFFLRHLRGEVLALHPQIVSHQRYPQAVTDALVARRGAHQFPGRLFKLSVDAWMSHTVASSVGMSLKCLKKNSRTGSILSCAAPGASKGWTCPKSCWPRCSRRIARGTGAAPCPA